jgi:hypothetical protein
MVAERAEDRAALWGDQGSGAGRADYNWSWIAGWHHETILHLDSAGREAFGKWHCTEIDVFWDFAPRPGGYKLVSQVDIVRYPPRM